MNDKLEIRNKEKLYKSDYLAEKKLDPTVGIVLVNYNGEKFLNQCIESIKKIQYESYEIIVVDNASTDQSISNMLKKFPDVKVIYNEKNLGVTNGNNRGIEYCLEQKKEFILLLNNDTVVNEGFLKEMIEYSINNNNCMVVPKIYFYDNPNMINNHIGEFNFKKGKNEGRYYCKIDTGNFNEVEEIKMASTCALLVHNEVFRTIGMMDDRYFMYFDDTDFVYRTVKAGYNLFFVPNAIIYHKESSTAGSTLSPFKVYYLTRNRMLFMDMHCESRVDKVLCQIYRFIAFIKNTMKWIVSGNFSSFRAYFKAIRDYKNKKFYKQNVL